MKLTDPYSKLSRQYYGKVPATNNGGLVTSYWRIAGAYWYVDRVNLIRYKFYTFTEINRIISNHIAPKEK